VYQEIAAVLSVPGHRRAHHLGPAGSTRAHRAAAPPSPQLTLAAGPAARARPVMAYSGNRSTAFRPVSFGAAPVRSRSESVLNRTSKGTNHATSPDQDQVPAAPDRVGRPADHQPHDCPNMVFRLAVADDPHVRQPEQGSLAVPAAGPDRRRNEDQADGVRYIDDEFMWGWGGAPSGSSHCRHVTVGT